MERTRQPLAALLALLLALCALPLAARQAPPSPEEVLGTPLGRHFTDYAGIREYSRALAAASPRVEYRPYGETPERRELIQLVIALPEHLQRLDAILVANHELTLPDTPESRAREIAESNPAVVYFSYGVHGNESSSSEAALWTAWDLAREAPEVAGVLEALVVVIDPVANPDGRERYVQWFRSVVGAEPNPNPQAREHREPWPGGRFNHYLFDLNRDWAWLTQPETRARLATWNRWNPQVHVDFHEMSFESTYFFFPAADPINPIYPEHVLEWGRRFGEGNARAFDARGWPYFTGETYDLFYPSYGDSWPALLGAIGMTYEQAGGGAAGLAVRREDGAILTLEQRATQHRVAGNATLRTAAEGKRELLLDYAANQRAAGEGHPDVLLVPGEDPARAEALVELLLRQGIEVERAEQPFRARAEPYPAFEARRDFPAGSYRVPARQPRALLAATLLQPETELRAQFSYDISAWSLPYAYGVEAHQVAAAPDAGWASVESPAAVARRELLLQARPGSYGYLVPGGERTAPGIIRFLREGGQARVLSRASRFEGRDWPAGTWFLPAFGNDDLAARVAAAGLHRAAAPVSSGLSEEGIDLGSRRVLPVELPRVAVLAGEGVTPVSFGAHWHYLEQTLGLPFDALPVGDLTRAELDEYDVIVIPDASSTLLGERQRERLQGWVRQGGRLVASGGGAEAAAAIAGVSVRRTERAETPADRQRFLRGREERERSDWEERVPGTILPARLDPAHPLAWGAGLDGDPERLFLLHSGTRIFEPARNVESVAYFPADLRRISGVISPASLEHLEEGAWLATARVGEGSVTLFANDPLFRLFWRGTHPLYVNALLLGPRP